MSTHFSPTSRQKAKSERDSDAMLTYHDLVTPEAEALMLSWIGEPQLARLHLSEEQQAIIDQLKLREETYDGLTALQIFSYAFRLGAITMLEVLGEKHES